MTGQGTILTALERPNVLIGFVKELSNEELLPTKFFGKFLEIVKCKKDPIKHLPSLAAQECNNVHGPVDLMI